MSNTILLENSHPQSYDAALAKYLKSIPAAVLFHQLKFWSGKGIRRDGWFWKPSSELEEETGMTEDQIRLAIRKLKDAGFIEVKVTKAYGKPTRHFRLSSSLNLVVKPLNRAKTSLLGKNPFQKWDKTQKGVVENPNDIQSITNRPLQQSLGEPVKLTDEEKAKNLAYLDVQRRKLAQAKRLGY